MSDFKLTADGSDIDLSTSSVELVEGVDAIAQHLLIRLRFFKGEYFLNRRDGMPYFEDIFLENPNLTVINSVYQETILETPGVIDILRFDLSIDRAARKLSPEFSVSVTLSDEPLDFSQEFLIG